jgi:hypothetical protein
LKSRLDKQVRSGTGQNPKGFFAADGRRFTLIGQFLGGVKWFGDLDKMTIEEKIRVMESLWVDL